LGIPALIWGLRRTARGDLEDETADPDAPPEDRARMRRAVAVGLGVWMLTGIVLFSYMERLHPRYVEAFTPAVAAMLGIGAAWAASARGRLRAAILAGTLIVVVIYGERLVYGTTGAWFVSLAAALGAIACAV